MQRRYAVAVAILVFAAAWALSLLGAIPHVTQLRESSARPVAYEYDVLPGIQRVNATTNTLDSIDLTLTCGWHSSSGCGNSGEPRSIDISRAGGESVYATVRATTPRDSGAKAWVKSIEDDEYVARTNPERTGCKKVSIALDDGAGIEPEIITYTHTIATVELDHPIAVPTTAGETMWTEVGTVATAPWQRIAPDSTIAQKGRDAGLGKKRSDGSSIKRVIAAMGDGTYRGVRLYGGTYYSNTDAFLWRPVPDFDVSALRLDEEQFAAGEQRYIKRGTSILRVSSLGAGSISRP